MSNPAELTAESLTAHMVPFLSSALDCGAVAVSKAAKLSGGAIQENWLLELTVPACDPPTRSIVLRTDAGSPVASSRTRAAEYAVLKVVWEQGLRVAKPIAVEPTGAVLGRPFFICDKLSGTAVGPKIVREPNLYGGRELLATDLARELAAIHKVRPTSELLEAIGTPIASPVEVAIGQYRDNLDRASSPSPVAELALSALEVEPPSVTQVAFCHRDFRTGNFMADGTGLTGILDWEFAGWSDPYEDLGWFCARSWRFGADGYEAGGLAKRTHFLELYSTFAGVPVDPRRVAWWETMANVRWATIALQQVDRFLVGGERSLDLALVGRRIPEIEQEILNLLQARERQK